MMQTSTPDRLPSSGLPDLSLAVPCYNEAGSIRHTTMELAQAFQQSGIDLELVLVDNGSTDDTGAVIDELIREGMPIVGRRIAVNQGYGDGVLRGLEYCRGRFVGIVCADGQVDAHDVARLYQIAVRARSPKLVKVRRRFRMDGLARKIVSILYNVLSNIMFGGLRSIDINGNPKIFPREYLDRMGLQSKDWFLDAEIMIKAKRLGLEVLELNVFAQMRAEGRSNVRPSTCAEFIVNLLRYRVRGWAGGRPDGGKVQAAEVVPTHERRLE